MKEYKIFISGVQKEFKAERRAVTVGNGSWLWGSTPEI